MIEDVYIEEDLPIPAATGWQEMHALLNKEMPVKKFKRRFLLLSLVPIAAMLIIFLSVSIRLNRDYYYNSMYNGKSNDHMAAGAIKKDKSTPLAIQLSTRKVLIQQRNDLYNNQTDINTAFPFKNPTNQDYKSHKKQIVSPIKYKAAPQQVKHINAVSVPLAVTKNLYKKWRLFAGAAINIATAGNQNLLPYPSFSARYYISPRVFISSGLSLFSPAQGRVSGVSKIVQVNDVSTNTSELNEVTSYSKMLYANLPITVGLQLNKHINVQAGLQSALLLSKKTSIEKIAYDFQMNRIEVNVVSTSYAPAAATIQSFNVKAPTTDYHFISGINYEINKTSLGLYYQHSLRKPTIPVNNLISLHLSWQLK